VSEALDALQNQVRAEPSEARHRVFLFQLLSVLGQWDRALTQLNVAGEMDAGNLGMVQVYREALASEALRTEVFAGNRTPLIFGDPEQWVALLLEALKLYAAGEFAKSEELRAEALEAAPTTSGRLNGREFEWIADADTRIGPMLEAIVNGRYFWVPFNHIAEMRVEEPEDLRDLVWLPAEFKWMNGGEAVALIPARYPGSQSSADPQIQLGRRTEWECQGEDLYTGLGQRVIVTDQDEISLLDIRNITLMQADGGDESHSNG
jgi:type VI secretion system protein ImpE